MISSISICSIIRACGEHGVSLFKMGDIEIRYGDSVELTTKLCDNENIHPKVDVKVNDEDEARPDDIEEEVSEEELLLSDPEAYETSLFKELGGQ